MEWRHFQEKRTKRKMIDFLMQLHHLVHCFKTKKLNVFPIFMFSLVREQVIAKEATFGIGRVRAATGRL
jgi:hypothetical protein